MLVRAFPLAIAVCIASSCGGTKNPPPPSPAAANSSSAASPGDGGSVPATPDAAVERPFAKNGAEASELIDKAVEGRHDRIKKCVEEKRARRKDPHAKVVVELGIDQEGILIGVKAPKGIENDDAFNTCVREALRDAPFPRSHAGVITVKKSFENIWVYPQ
jgi:hypothetical protein